MKNVKNLVLAILAVATLTLSSCLHIFEEVTMRADGSGQYKLTLDMSEMKSLLDMAKSMAPDSAGLTNEMGATPTDQLGDQLLGVKSTLESVPGITNITEVKDTATFIFSYGFDFKDANSLNTALKLLTKEKYEQKSGDVFAFEKKKFTRLPNADIGSMFSTMLEKGADQAGEEAGMAGSMQMFFADMTYEQIYRFPDHTVKKSSNSLSQIEDDGHTVRITLRPFDEEQKKTSPTVGTEISLKK